MNAEEPNRANQIIIIIKIKEIKNFKSHKTQ